jgi:hypothetical protein
MSKANLVELEVVFGDAEYKYNPGGKVLIKPYIDVPPYIKDSYVYEEQEFLMIPKNMIVGYQPPSWSDNSNTTAPSIWTVPKYYGDPFTVPGANTSVSYQGPINQSLTHV